MMVIGCHGIFQDPINAAQKRNETYLLEPLGKSTTKEDHERIQISERERSNKEKKKTENRNHESKGDHQEMKPRSGKNWKLLNP